MVDYEISIGTMYHRLARHKDLGYGILSTQVGVTLSEMIEYDEATGKTTIKWNGSTHSIPRIPDSWNLKKGQGLLN